MLMLMFVEVKLVRMQSVLCVLSNGKQGATPLVAKRSQPGREAYEKITQLVV